MSLFRRYLQIDWIHSWVACETDTELDNSNIQHHYLNCCWSTQANGVGVSHNYKRGKRRERLVFKWEQSFMTVGNGMEIG